MQRNEATVIEQQMRNIGVIGQSHESKASIGNNSQNSVNPNRNPVNSSYQQPPTNLQQNTIKLQQLSEQGQQAKLELEILAATGKTKDLTGKAITLQDLDNMLEQDILKFYRIYQSNVAAKTSEAFSQITIKAYSKFSNWVLPIKDEEKLYTDLRSDYILMNELEKWIGYFCLKMGSLTALTSVGLITINNCDFGSVINGRNTDPGTKGNDIEQESEASNTKTD